MPVLHTFLQEFSRLEEKRPFALDQFLLAQLGLAIGSHGVHDYTVLSVVESCDVRNAKNFLVHIWNVRLRIVERYQPLFARFSLFAVDVSEGSFGLQMQRFLNTIKIRYIRIVEPYF